MFVLFTSGSINSGKTTVSKILTQRIPKTAHIEVDSLRNFIEWIPLLESIPLNLENACRVAETFLAHELNIIISYPLIRENYDFFCERLKPFKPAFYFVSLNPSLEVVAQDRGKRKLSPQERTRIRYLYSIGINDPGFGHLIDNSRQTPDETADEIKRILGL